ncbi:MAG TPA: PAS domain-containing sensor histidine kinase [Candidatus Polarisedimenticolia bacterium]|jgi:PAS domain S-box-containing protein|nr:PAS domain-containing sensor histidine kinase [Candidatus Polarisedimenticolia bacterium]
MDASLESSLLLVAGVTIFAGVLAVALAILGIGLLRRSLRRLTALVEEVRRHPLIGNLPADPDPIVGALAREMNGLVADLRGRLEESRGQFSDLECLASGPPDLAVVGTDSDWGVTFFSRGAVALTQWAVEDIAGRHVESLFHPGEWDRILPKLARRSLREAGISETLTMLRRDGSTFPAQVSIAGLPGNGRGMLVAARDLSAERSLEVRLRESEERHRSLVEGMSDGVFVLQGDRLVYANPALASMLDVRREEIEGASIKTILHTHDLLRVLEVVRRAQSGRETAGEISCLLLSASSASVEARLAWARTEFQGVPALVGTVTDVTRRARSERALAGSEARLQATLESAGDGILVLEDGGKGLEVTLVNRAFCDRFGAPRDALLGRGVEELGSLLRERSADPGVIEALLAEAAARRETRAEGLELLRPRHAVVDLLAGPVRSGSGDEWGVILTARDMTRRIEDENRLRQSLEEQAKAKAELETACRELATAQKDLAERNEQLVKLNGELKSLDEMKSNLLANVSHELHTPLVSIKGYTEMILKRRLGPLTPEQERGLGVALKNIDRLIEMIDNLLSFSRIEKGETQMRLEDVPLWQVVDESIEMVGERMRRKNLAVTTQYETDELVVRGDRVKIGQVLVNLLTNAVKFNREGGRITLAARKGPRGFLEVEVADTGIGIPKEAQEKIFERFYQVDASAGRQYEGTGIGLSIVRDILRLHGSDISVRSEVGQGSVFTFTLPLARDQQLSTPRPGHGRGRSEG